MKRTKLASRVLPTYSHAEELMNMITHIAGGGLAVIALVLLLCKASFNHGPMSMVTCAIYGGTMLLVYTMSSIYHGLHPGTAKKVLQILDHCSIYLLIAGTYTPIVLCALAPVYPWIGWGLLSVQWVLAALATALTAIDLKKYKVFSMICYIGMGWSVIFFLPQTLSVMTPAGFGWLLAGGIAYSIGAVLFGLGSKVKWMHSIFHLFVLLGSSLQFLAVYWYVL